MKWFDRWFARKWRWAWENRDVLEEAMTSGQTRPARLATVEDESWEDGLRISIKKK